jgi:hypothetical protein
MVMLRRATGEGGARQAALRAAQVVLARAYATRLRPHHTHLVVDQQLLLPLLDAGALGGRTFDVLMASLPSSAVQARLDAAARRWPGAKALVDFRVNLAQERREWAALSRARRVVTAHRDVAQHLSEHGLETVELLAWAPPVSIAQRQPRPPVALPVIGFPASALARKGVNELAAAARELGWAVLVLGSPAADPDIWRGVDVRQGRYGMDWLAQVDLVVLPAHVEHAPRALLQALAHSVPVVATAACGLSGEEGLLEVIAGDVPGLIASRVHAPDPAAPSP